MAYSRSIANEDSPHRLVKLGIKTLDERIKGFPNNSLILLLGDPGSGFTTFLHQILISREKGGSSIFYVTLDRPKKEILWDLSTYNWIGESWDFTDISPAAEKEGPGIGWRSDAVNLLSHDLIRKISSIKKEGRKGLKPLRLDSAIDSISSMLLDSDLKTVRAFINEYMTEIRDTNGLHFIIMGRGMHGREAEQTLSHVADCVLEFKVVEGPSEFHRVMGIKKMRGVSMPTGQLFPLEYTAQGVMPVTTEKLR
ncbi:MAG: RAD55 family ATPase [Candidatus Hodarchaeales archaeon]|jgi:KaiC/GvpD/RAD55 family RecA-like ATPase